MDCLNNWDCIDGCYSRHVLNGFSQCKCFDTETKPTTETMTTTTTPFKRVVECYICAEMTLNGVNACKNFEPTDNFVYCETEVGCYASHSLNFSEKYPGGMSKETLFKRKFKS